MKSARKMFAVTVATLFCCGPAAAAQTGALATTLGQGGFALSANWGYSQRDVRDGESDKASSFRSLFRAQLGVATGLDLYALLGFADVELDDAGFEGTLGENLGLGAHYTMLKFADSGMRLMLDVQGEYIRSESETGRLRHQGYHAATYLLREYGAAGRTGYFYPYAGVRVSYVRYDGRGVDDFTARGYLGVFGGADYFVNPNVFFAGEVHVFDETSLYLGVGYRF